jgi:hypothetical protein
MSTLVVAALLSIVVGTVLILATRDRRQPATRRPGRSDEQVYDQAFDVIEDHANGETP